MRVIIAGSRHAEGNRWKRALMGAVKAFEDSHGAITVCVSGKAPGMDTIGEAWAKWRGVPVDPYPAAWTARGRAAGPERNARMAEVADGLVCLHDGGPGSADMMRRARAKGLPCVVVDMR